jgi:hypothetical protein
MHEKLVVELVGEWREELRGTDLLSLEPAPPGGARLELTLRADGTALWGYARPGEATAKEPPGAPFPQKWELSADRVLTVWVPVPPNLDPEYEMSDWTWEAFRYDVMTVSTVSLGLSDRPYDGESVIVLRRVNTEGYDRRKVEAYREALEGLREFIRRSDPEGLSAHTDGPEGGGG